MKKYKVAFTAAFIFYDRSEIFNFGELINYFPDLKINELTEEHIRKFQDYMVSKRKVAISTQNQAINAIKFYYEKIIGGENKTYLYRTAQKIKTFTNSIE